MYLQVHHVSKKKKMEVIMPLLLLQSAPLISTMTEIASAPSFNEFELINRDKNELIDLNADLIKEKQGKYLTYPKLKFAQQQQQTLNETETEAGGVVVATENDDDLIQSLLKHDAYLNELNIYYKYEIESELGSMLEDFPKERNQSDLAYFYVKHQFTI